LKALYQLGLFSDPKDYHFPSRMQWIRIIILRFSRISLCGV